MKKIFLSVAILLTTALCMKVMAMPARNLGPVNFTLHQPAQTKSVDLDAKPVVKTYLLIRDALVAGDNKAAASAGTDLANAMKQLEKSASSSDEKQVLNKEGKAAIKGAEIIGKSSDIKEQRTAFKEVSEHLYRILKVIGTPATLYWDHCPMAKANWLSDKKTIANPYYGQSMLTCGRVTETLSL